MRAIVIGLAWVGLVACGGTAVVDGTGGAGGAGGATSTSSNSSTSTTSSTSSGTTGCSDHADCPPNSVCIYATGTCAPSCGDICEACPAGEICNACATGSCPGCLDCIGACVPASPGQCDDHDDCAADELCVFSTGSCEPACDAIGCADPNLVCADCVTTSCRCCDDCAAVCLSPP